MEFDTEKAQAMLEAEMVLRGALKPKTIDWNHVYLLGWYDRSGKPYLTTWIDTPETESSYITVVVTGPDVTKWGPPMWSAPANCRPNPYGFPSHHYSEYELHEVRPGEKAQELAQRLGGVRALGWYFEKGFERKWNDGGTA